MSEEQKKNSIENENGNETMERENKAKESLGAIPRLYAMANEHRDIDVSNIVLHHNSTNDWKVFARLGRGKYSEVFEGKNMKTGELSCIKILKPCQSQLLKLEIKILQLLNKGPNIISLLDTLKDEKTDLWCLVFEIMHGSDFKQNIPKISTDYEMRYYLFKIMQGLDYAHSQGIMHRDIKPQNILVDLNKKQVRIIDWGLGAFYYPKHNYSVRVATRAFKAPELLVDMHQYHYSIDIWAFACMFAGILFNKTYFFHGKDFDDQLYKIIEILGTENFFIFLKKYQLNIPTFLNHLQKPENMLPKKNWLDFVVPERQKFINPIAIDFLDKMLVYDPNERLTTKEALQHPYFKEFYKIQSN